MNQEKYAQINHHFQEKQSKTCKKKKKVRWLWHESITGEELIHWRKHYYELWTHILAIRNGLQLKCLNGIFVAYRHSFLLHKTLTDGLEWCGLLVDYCDVFISCLDSHSDGTHSLQSIHWWTSDVMPNFSKSVSMKKQTHLHLGRPEGDYYIFG